MSSFIIGKENYIKAAGLVAGLAEGLELWIYNYEKSRNSTADDYYDQFVKFHQMNALSVMEQYDGDEVGAPATDPEEYRDQFEEYKEYGKTIAITREGLTDSIKRLDHFFGSVIYQTEKDAYMFNMEYYFNKVIVALWEKVHNCRDNDCYGEFSIDPPKTRIMRII
jgi:hypothetical protein